MSNPVRLLLASGTTPARSRDLAQAVVAGATGEGLRARLVSAGRGVGAGQAALTSGLGAALRMLGADPLVAQAWSGLAGLRQLTSLVEADQVLVDSETDLVVVDAGDLTACIDLVAMPAVLARLLDSLLTARLAMASSTEDSLAGAIDAFEDASALRASAERWAAMLGRDDTAVRILAHRDDPIDAVTGGVDALRLLGVGVDGVEIAELKSGESEATSSGKSGAKKVKKTRSERSIAGAWKQAVDPVPVWSSRKSGVRAAAKGRSVTGPFGTSGAAVSESVWEISADDDGFALRIPLPARVAARAQVGYQREALIIEWEGFTRWLRLPSVLTRCVAVDAIGFADAVVVRWVPDHTRWPASMSPAAASSAGVVR